MIVRRFIVAALALGLVGALPATASANGTHHRWQHRHHGVEYVFRGTLVSEPTAGSMQVNVTGGNRRALRAVLGATQPLTFTIDGRTTYVKWTGHTPTSTTLGDFHTGDTVRVRVRARRGAPLSRLTAKPAHRVADLTDWARPAGKQYIVFGRLAAVDTTAQTLTVDVRRGNDRALRVLVGQPTTQTFRYDASTTFVRWERGGPVLLGASNLAAGDKIRLRLFAPGDASLQTMLATPAAIVAQRERAPRGEHGHR